MSERSYLHLASKRSSWHVLGKVTDDGWFSRCGLSMGHEYRASPSLPWGEKTCEHCAVSVLRDEDDQGVDTDVVA